MDGSPSSGVGTSTQDYSYATTTSSTSPMETIVQEYQTADGGIGKRVLKTFTTQQTTTKTTRYGSDGALRSETTIDSTTPYMRQTSPMPARSSSSMSKLTHHVDENCKHGHHHHHHNQKITKPAGYSLYHVERREETTRSSSGGSGDGGTQPISTTPTGSSRKVKFQDEEFINRKEFEQACSSLQSSTKDIDILPDPELDTGKCLNYFSNLQEKNRYF